MNLQGCRVLVTGADGFIGSHLVERLVREGATVRALCCYNSTGSSGWLDDVERDIRESVDLRLGDIRDAELCAALAERHDLILHLAALIAIPYSYVAPRSFIDTNVVGTLNVLEAARRNGVERVIHTSTSEVYGTPDSVPITESHTLKGQSPYSASKIAADKLCEAWALSYGLNVTVLRPFNTYGPRQSARAVIPTMLNQMLAGISPLRLGSLEPRRDFTFVTDTVDGFIRAAVADLAPGEVIHLGTGTSISIRDLVQRAATMLGVETQVTIEEVRVRPAGSEVLVLQSDPSRALDRLGWRPTVDMDLGLRRTAEWLDARLVSERAAVYQR